MRRDGASAYEKRATTQVDPGGAYRATYVADATYSYYAESGGVRSSVISTAVPYRRST